MDGAWGQLERAWQALQDERERPHGAHLWEMRELLGDLRALTMRLEIAYEAEAHEAARRLALPRS